MEASAFDPAKFPYTTKDPELLKCIEQDLSVEATPIAERVEKLTDVAKGKAKE